MFDVGFALAVAALGFAAAAGFALKDVLISRLRILGYRRKIGGLAANSPAIDYVAGGEGGGVEGRVIALLLDRSRRRMDDDSSTASYVRLLAPGNLHELSLAAGCGEAVNAAGFVETSLLASLLCAAFGFATGSLGSMTLGLILAVLGFVLGWVLPRRTLEKRIRDRADDAERHLPEMLDVISLGLRSGLSFDRSLEFYLSNFENGLSRSYSSAYERYTRGFATREEALLDLAASYESAALSQVTGSMVRSLRFGSSLAESLEGFSRQIRADYKARKEEEVAKAPVKMMIPTGALILPAMLILVLGPVMLELAVGL